MVGHDVSELLPELTLAQKWDLTALELGRNVHTHPSLSESLQDAFHGLQAFHQHLTTTGVVPHPLPTVATLPATTDPNSQPSLLR